jgi:hypothetical protein
MSLPSKKAGDKREGQATVFVEPAPVRMIERLELREDRVDWKIRVLKESGQPP